MTRTPIALAAVALLVDLLTVSVIEVHAPSVRHGRARGKIRGTCRQYSRYASPKRSLSIGSSTRGMYTRLIARKIPAHTASGPEVRSIDSAARMKTTPEIIGF